MKFSEKLMKVAVLVGMIWVLGWMNISTAQAQERTDPVEVERSTAEACYSKIQEFDALLSEAVQLKNQKEQCWGASSELRRIMNSMNTDLTTAQGQRNALQMQLDQSIESRPRRAVWFAVGASTGVVITVVAVILLADL